MGWPFWDSVLIEPMTLKVPQLKEAAKLLGLGAPPTKAELILRLLGTFDLCSPTSMAPAQLLLAIKAERTHYNGRLISLGGQLRPVQPPPPFCRSSKVVVCWDDPRCAALKRCVHTLANNACTNNPPIYNRPGSFMGGNTQGGLAGARAGLVKEGFTNMQQLEQAAQIAQKEQQEREAARRREAE
eukprot:gene12517-12651_t